MLNIMILKILAGIIILICACISIAFFTVAERSRLVYQFRMVYWVYWELTWRAYLQVLAGLSLVWIGPILSGMGYVLTQVEFWLGVTEFPLMAVDSLVNNSNAVSPLLIGSIGDDVLVETKEETKSTNKSDDLSRAENGENRSWNWFERIVVGAACGVVVYSISVFLGTPITVESVDKTTKQMATILWQGAEIIKDAISNNSDGGSDSSACAARSSLSDEGATLPSTTIGGNDILTAGDGSTTDRTTNTIEEVSRKAMLVDDSSSSKDGETYNGSYSSQGGAAETQLYSESARILTTTDALNKIEIPATDAVIANDCEKCLMTDMMSSEILVANGMTADSAEKSPTTSTGCDAGASTINVTVIKSEDSSMVNKPGGEGTLIANETTIKSSGESSTAGTVGGKGTPLVNATAMESDGESSAKYTEVRREVKDGIVRGFNKDEEVILMRWQTLEEERNMKLELNLKDTKPGLSSDERKEPVGVINDLKVLSDRGAAKEASEMRGDLSPFHSKSVSKGVASMCPEKLSGAETAAWLDKRDDEILELRQKLGLKVDLRVDGKLIPGPYIEPSMVEKRRIYSIGEERVEKIYDIERNLDFTNVLFHGLSTRDALQTACENVRADGPYSGKEMEPWIKGLPDNIRSYLLGGELGALHYDIDAINDNQYPEFLTGKIDIIKCEGIDDFSLGGGKREDFIIKIQEKAKSLSVKQ